MVVAALVNATEVTASHDLVLGLALCAACSHSSWKGTVVKAGSVDVKLLPVPVRLLWGQFCPNLPLPSEKIV